MVFAKVAKAETIQVALMGWIAEGAEIGVVRRLDAQSASVAQQPVKLLHCAHDIAQMFDYVNRGNAVERLVGKGIRKTVEVGQNIGAAGGIAIEPNGAGLLANPAADVEDFH